MDKFRDIMYNTVTIDNTAQNLKIAKSIFLKLSPHTQLSLFEVMNVLKPVCGNHFAIYTIQNHYLYTLNLHNVMSMISQ